MLVASVSLEPGPEAALDQPIADRPSPPGEALLLTNDLLLRAKSGDAGALDALIARYLPRLERWARGRLPRNARSMLDTSDLVHETLLRVIQGLDRIEVRGPGGFQAYVRSALLNRIRDEVRWAGRRPGPDGVPETLADSAPSPIEHAIGAELLGQYERALAALDPEERELLHLRIELAFDYQEIATMTGRPSRDAVRMAIQRALRRLADGMGHGR